MKRGKKSPHSWKKPRRTKENAWTSEDGLVRENKVFEQYYKLQHIVPEDEYDLFLEYLVRTNEEV